MKQLSYSQSKQDLFARLVNPNPGFYIEIGSSIPTWQNNSRLLLENSWSGVNVDIQDHAEEWKPYPNAKFIQADATEINWREVLQDGNGKLPTISYCSCDVDSCTYDALVNLLGYGIHPLAMTLEHDYYRFGDMLRSSERELMDRHGYVRVVSDVKGDLDSPYEDFYVHPSVPNIEEIKKELATWGLT